MSTSRRRSRVEAERAAQAWNAAHRIGAAVNYWPGVKQGEGKYGVTRSEAFVSDGGDAVVFLEKVSGFVALTHVEARK